MLTVVVSEFPTVGVDNEGTRKRRRCLFRLSPPTRLAFLAFLPRAFNLLPAPLSAHARSFLATSTSVSLPFDLRRDRLAFFSNLTTFRPQKKKEEKCNGIGFLTHTLSYSLLLSLSLFLAALPPPQ